MRWSFRTAEKHVTNRRRLSLASLLIRYALMLAGIAFIAFLPLICALGAGTIASMAGCQLDEGSVHACYILGEDRGPLLYEMGVLGWFILMSFPAGILLLICWAIALIAQLYQYYRIQ